MVGRKRENVFRQPLSQRTGQMTQTLVFRGNRTEDSQGTLTLFWGDVFRENRTGLSLLREPSFWVDVGGNGSERGHGKSSFAVTDYIN